MWLLDRSRTESSRRSARCSKSSTDSTKLFDMFSVCKLGMLAAKSLSWDQIYFDICSSYPSSQFSWPGCKKCSRYLIRDNFPSFVFSWWDYSAKTDFAVLFGYPSHLFLVYHYFPAINIWDQCIRRGFLCRKSLWSANKGRHSNGGFDKVCALCNAFLCIPSSSWWKKRFWIEEWIEWMVSVLIY